MQMASLTDQDADGNMLAGLIIDKKAVTPLEELELKEIRELIKQVLNEKEALLVILYYYEEFTLKEIGEVLGVSESRVCQMHTEILQKMRIRLKKLKGFS